ncbi:MAG: hypothetical protein PVJ89_07380 [Planctomycetota bacterium]|jgi:hypothetical protein
MGTVLERGGARVVAAWLIAAAGAVPATAAVQDGARVPAPAAGNTPAPAPARGGERWAARLELGLAEALDLTAVRAVPAGAPPAGPSVSLAPVKASVARPLAGTTSLRLDSDAPITRLQPRPLRPLPELVVLADALVGDDATGPLSVGQEFVVQPADAGVWSYLRVVDVGEDRVALEVCTAPLDVGVMVRAPRGLRVADERGAFRLRWDRRESELGVTYRVRRRGPAAAAPARDGGKGSAEAVPGPWETLALVTGDQFRDRDAPWGRPVHYEVTAVDGEGRPLQGHLGERVVAARVDTPGEWAFGVTSGARIDLVSGRSVGPDDLAHVEFHSGATGQFSLKPLGEVRFALEQKVAAPGGLERWWLPPASDRRFVPGRTAVVAAGGELEFRLPDGTLGRLALEGGDGPNARLKRHLALDGDRLLPRPPRQRPEVHRTDDDDVELRFAVLGRGLSVPPARVAIVVEKEVAFGQGDWAVVTEGLPGARTVALEGIVGGPTPIVRLRFRHRVESGGLSHPSRPMDLLADGRKGERREALLQTALESIDDEDFQRRLEARGVLVALGDLARGPLAELSRSDRKPRALAAQSILESIESGDGSGAGVARRVHRRALELAREAPRLAALSDEERAALFAAYGPDLRFEEQGERVHSLMRFVDRAERGVMRPDGAPGDLRDDCEIARVWAMALAQTEPDAGARKLATFVADLGAVPSMASFESSRPAFLPDGEPLADVGPLPGASWTDLPGAAEELVWLLERRPELADLEFGPPLAQLLHRLRSPDEGASPSAGPAAGGEDDARLFDYDARNAELVLRLLERARSAAEPDALLEAAAQLAGGEEALLLAQREVSDRRLASPSARGFSRRTVELEEPSLDLLEAAMQEVADRQSTADPAAPVEGVDILLPAGVYEDVSGVPNRTLEVLGSGIRLMPARPGAAVEVRAALRVSGARDLVLQDLTLVSETTTAINVIEGGHLVVLDSRVAGAGTVLFLQDGDLEMVGSRVESAGSGKNPQWAIRELGRCRLYVRASLLDAGSIYVSDESENWLDRTVLDAGSRTLLQSPRAGHLVARECLLRGTNLGLYNVERGVLAGVVIDVPRDPLGRRPSGLRVATRFFHLVGEGQVVPATMRLENEPLRPR